MFIFMPADAEARVLHQRQSDAKRAFRVGVTSSGLYDPGFPFALVAPLRYPIHRAYKAEDNF
jgi:hypothetical protein